MFENTFARWEVQVFTSTLARADLDPEVRPRVGLEVLGMAEGFEVIMQIRLLFALLQLCAAKQPNRTSDVIQLIPSFHTSSDYFSWLCGFLEGRARGLSAHTNISHTNTTEEAFKLLKCKLGNRHTVMLN